VRLAQRRDHAFPFFLEQPLIDRDEHRAANIRDINLCAGVEEILRVDHDGQQVGTVGASQALHQTAKQRRLS